jgi:aminopeptidase N
MADLYMEVLEKDMSYGVQAAGLQGLFKVNPEAAMEKAKALESAESDDLLAGIGVMYASSGDASFLPFFEKNLGKVDNEAAAQFIGAYLGLAFQAGPDTLGDAINKTGAIAKDQSSSLWRRYSYTMALAEMRGMMQSEEMAENTELVALLPGLNEQLSEIKAAETNSQLKAMFMSL